MSIVFFVMACAAGGLVGAFVLGQIFTLARFGIPTAFQWYRNGWLTARVPVSRYVLILVLFAALFVAVSWSATQFFPEHAAAYWSGVAVAGVYGLIRSGATSSNADHFVRSNLAYINHAVADKLTTKLGIADFFRGRKGSKGA